MQPSGDGEKKPTGRRIAIRPAGFYAWPDRGAARSRSPCRDRGLLSHVSRCPRSPVEETRTIPYAKAPNTYSNSNHILQNQGHSRNRNHQELNNNPNIRPDEIELKDIR